MKNFIYYLPRVLACLVTAFFLFFFIGEGLSLDMGWVAAGGHLVQMLLVIVPTIIAWKWPKIGGWLFLPAGLLFLAASFQIIFSETAGRSNFAPLVLTLILITISVLFLLEGYKRKPN